MMKLSVVGSTMAFGALILVSACQSAVSQEPGSAETQRSPDSVEVVIDTVESWTLPTPHFSYGLREGQRLFLHYCSHCHGVEGAGDGFNAFNLDPAPRDLSDPAFQTARTDRELADLIRIGGGAAGLSNAMPPWGKTINDREVLYLIEFLRTLGSSTGSGAGAR